MTRTRTCVGCRQRAEPAGWSRVAATRQGPLAIGPGAPGRGAWICSAGCFDTAIARGALARALRRELTSAEVADLRATLFA